MTQAARLAQHVASRTSAVVVGIDSYPYWEEGSRDLRAASSDALRTCDWLLETGVPPRRIFLALASSTPVPDAYGRVSRSGGTWVDIRRAVARACRLAEAGDRLIFYFAGHAVRAISDRTYHDYLLPSDYAPTTDYRRNSLQLLSLLHYFQYSNFETQFFFFDCCRVSAPCSADEMGQFEASPWLGPAFSIQRHEFYATQANATATEFSEGVFTAALLAGLSGTGRAKSWSPEHESYVVRVEQLFEFVQHHVRERVPTQIPAKQAWQCSGNGNPVVTPIEAVPKVKLLVRLIPRPPGATVSASSDALGVEAEQPEESTSNDFRFQLLPGVWRIRATAPGYLADSGSLLLELYDNSQSEMQLTPLASGSSPQRNRSPRSLTVEALEAHASVEILDSQRTVLARGARLAKLSEGDGLVDGIYLARLVTPEGEIASQRVEIGGGGPSSVVVKLAAPDQAAALAQWSQSFGLESRLDEGLAARQPATVLAVHAGWEADLNPGITTFRQAAKSIPSRSGVKVMVAVDPADRGATVWFRLWKQGEEVPGQTGLLVQAGAAESVVSCAPGAYWLWLQQSSTPEREIVTPLFVTSRRMTVAVVSLVEAKVPAAEFFQLPISPAEQLERKELETLDIAQRNFAGERLAAAWESVRPVLDRVGIEPDPVTTCLAGYIALLDAKPRQLEAISRRLILFFPSLPDGWILKAESCHIDNTSYYVKALDCGVPQFSEGLRRLAVAAKRYGIEHPRLSLIDSLRRRLVRSPWSMTVFRGTEPSRPLPNDQPCTASCGELALKGAQLGVLRVQELVGKGAYGRVYRGVIAERSVAIKFLDEKLLDQPKCMADFHREFRILKALQSVAGVVSVQSDQLQVTPTGIPFFSMEFVPGVSLRELVEPASAQPDVVTQGERAVGLSLTLVLNVARSLLDVVERIHQTGVVHRDLKSSHVFVEREAWTVTILDFGLARFLDSSEDNLGEPTREISLDSIGPIGTPGYDAPELRSGAQTADHRTDLYSVGKIIYEMITGSFEVKIGKPPDIPVELWDVLSCALEDDPNQRHQSASEFLLSLNEVVEAGEELERASRTVQEKIRALVEEISTSVSRTDTGRDRSVVALTEVWDALKMIQSVGDDLFKDDAEYFCHRLQKEDLPETILSLLELLVADGGNSGSLDVPAAVPSLIHRLASEKVAKKAEELLQQLRPESSPPAGIPGFLRLVTSPVAPAVCGGVFFLGWFLLGALGGFSVEDPRASGSVGGPPFLPWREDYLGHWFALLAVLVGLLVSFSRVRTQGLTLDYEVTKSTPLRRWIGGLGLLAVLGAFSNAFFVASSSSNLWWSQVLIPGVLPALIGTAWHLFTYFPLALGTVCSGLEMAEFARNGEWDASRNDRRFGSSVLSPMLLSLYSGWMCMLIGALIVLTLQRTGLSFGSVVGVVPLIVILSAGFAHPVWVLAVRLNEAKRRAVESSRDSSEREWADSLGTTPLAFSHWLLVVALFLAGCATVLIGLGFA